MDLYRSKNVALTDQDGDSLDIVGGNLPMVIKDSAGVNNFGVDSDGEIKVKISNGTIQAGIDTESLLLGMITRTHKAIHDGISYVVIHQGTKNNGETLIISFKTPNTAIRAHLFMRARASGEANYVILEGAVVTNGTGTEKAIINRERNSLNTSTVIDNATSPVAGNVTLDPTVTGNGTTIFEEHFGAGKTVGGQSRGEDEFILKQNTQYVLKITSETATNDVEFLIDYYEI